MFFGFKKSIASLLVLVILAPSAFLVLSPKPAHAYVPIDQKDLTSITQIIGCIRDYTSKDNCGDVIAWGVAKLALNALSKMIIEWVKTGNVDFAETYYGGAQTWILNFEQYLQGAVDHAAGIFIGELLGPTVQAQLCSPFRVPLTDYFRNNYGSGFPQFPHAQCTLTQIVNNIEDFQIDFSQGGNAAFLEMFLNPSNNPIGARWVEDSRLENMAIRRAMDASLESQSNQGFIGIKKCVKEVAFAEGTYCEKYETVTPGKTVQDHLAEALKSELKAWQHADEISEIIAGFIVALTQALIEKGLNEGL